MELSYLLDWLNLLGRWVHMIVGIAWIGASFYFVWLDNHLEAPTDAKLRDAGVSGELWAVHGGGFYNPQKYRGAPPVLPTTLHWFKWEAYTTWLSGMFMLGLIYYAGAGTYLIDKGVADLSPLAAILIGLAFLAGGWLSYDRLCASPLERHEGILLTLLGILFAVAAWGLCQLFSGRGAYIHFGAMLGTIMVANVFFVIIPGQRAMVEAARAGQTPNPIHGQRGKQRSVHNTYFTLPVLFTMISNHYPITWGASYNWLVLIVISAAGVGIRLWFVMRHKQAVTGRTPPWPLLAGLILLAGVIIALWPRSERAANNSTTSPTAAAPDSARVMAIVAQRCVSCHAAQPTQAGVAIAPKGVLLETPAQVKQHAAMVRAQIATGAMPIGNLTAMTADERRAVIEWINNGAAR